MKININVYGHKQDTGSTTTVTDVVYGFVTVVGGALSIHITHVYDPNNCNCFNCVLWT
jgi:hypothetical protein